MTYEIDEKTLPQMRAFYYEKRKTLFKAVAWFVVGYTAYFAIFIRLFNIYD